MDLAFAFLADAAQIRGGKLDVQGGGLVYFEADGYPAIIPSLALVASVRIDSEERDGPHELTVTPLDPRDELLAPVKKVGFQVDRIADNPRLPGYHTFALNLQNVPLAIPGRYRFFLDIDGKRLGEVALETWQGSGSHPSR